MPFAVNALAAAVIAIAIPMIDWPAFRFDLSLAYLYLSFGIVAAAQLIAGAFRTWKSRGRTLQERIINDVIIRQTTASARGIFGLALRLVKEASLRLTYWPLEFSLLSLQEKVNQAQDLARRSFVGLHFAPKLPVLSASWMLAINLFWLGLWHVFKFGPGGPFQIYVTVSLLATIVWFLDFFINPIEVQIRCVGTFKEAVWRFTLVCVLSLFAAVVLIYTYRLTTTPGVSFIDTLRDVLFGGLFNDQLKTLKEGVSKSLVSGDFKAAWTEFSNIDRSFIVSMCVCTLFYLTIAKRLLPLIWGGGSMLRRTEQESRSAASAALQLGEFATARTYAAELPPDDPVPALIDFREALEKRQFDRAYGMIDDLSYRRRRYSKLKENVELDAREKWLALAMLCCGLDKGLGDLDFARWSIERPELELRDLAKYIVLGSLHGGAAQVTAFAHLLYVDLQNGGARANHFRETVVSRFLTSTWEESSAISPKPESFASSYLDYLVAVAQAQRALFLFGDAPIVQRLSSDLFQRAFGNFLITSDPRQWVDALAFGNLQSADRFYIVDILIGLASAGDGQATENVSAAILDAKAKLEEQWGGPVYDRIGISAKELGQITPSLGAALR